MSVVSEVQYCAKVTQTKCIEFRSLFSQYFVEIAIEISESSDAFLNDFAEGNEILQ